MLSAVVAFGFLQSDVSTASAFALLLPLAAAVWFRKRWPLVACMAALVIALVAAQTADPSRDLSVIGVMVVVYAVARWASGRHALIGLIIVVLVGPSISTVDATFSAEGLPGVSAIATVIESLINSVIWLVPYGAGIVVRNRAIRHAKEVLAARSNERAEFARELHDTVAHHISAIAIRAQAGKAVGATRPDAAIGALDDIESEATRTLDEMRQMVRALRSADDPAALAPHAGIREIQALADPTAQPPVLVDIAGAFDSLSASVESSLFRIAQEATTNARRHARDASEIRISVVADATDVHLTIADDGRKQTLNDRSAGFGLIGMAERAALLDGRFRAAPGTTGGWVVEAALPRSGVPA